MHMCLPVAHLVVRLFVSVLLASRLLLEHSVSVTSAGTVCHFVIVAYLIRIDFFVGVLLLVRVCLLVRLSLLESLSLLEGLSLLELVGPLPVRVGLAICIRFLVRLGLL